MLTCAAPLHPRQHGRAKEAAAMVRAPGFPPGPPEWGPRTLPGEPDLPSEWRPYPEPGFPPAERGDPDREPPPRRQAPPEPAGTP